MNRCLTRRAHLALAALTLSFGFVAGASAQESIRREPPKDVVLAKMTVVQPPAIQIDGKDDRLSPGSRIHDTRNMLVLSASLAGQTLPVVYKRDAAGLVHEVWLLSPDEYKRLGGVGNNNVQAFLDLLAAIFGARR